MIDLDQGDWWEDRFGQHHPISQMAVSHRIYSARLLERKARVLALHVYTSLPEPNFKTMGDMTFNALERQQNELLYHPDRWIRTTKLYRALLDIPETI